MSPGSPCGEGKSELGSNETKAPERRPLFATWGEEEQDKRSQKTQRLSTARHVAAVANHGATEGAGERPEDAPENRRRPRRTAKQRHLRCGHRVTGVDKSMVGIAGRYSAPINVYDAESPINYAPCYYTSRRADFATGIGGQRPLPCRLRLGVPWKFGILRERAFLCDGTWDAGDNIRTTRSLLWFRDKMK